MNMNRIWRSILLPHIAVMIALVPISAAVLIFSMTSLGSEHPVSYVAYVLSAYTLTVWCIRIPDIVKGVKSFKEENKYVRFWLSNERLRVVTSLCASVAFNTAYAILLLILGIYHSSFWFSSISAYYVLLVLMRLFLVHYAVRKSAGEDMRAELVRYRICGMVFLLMNIALSVILFFMVYFDRSFHHHEITTIALAAYTFTTLVFAIMNTIKYRKYKSPVYSASKAISLAGACVSMLTLESTMMTTFGDGTADAETRKIMLGVSGAVVSAVIVAMAVYMIAVSTKKLKLIGNEKEVNAE